MILNPSLSLAIMPTWAKRKIKSLAKEHNRSYHEELSIIIAIGLDEVEK